MRHNPTGVDATKVTNQVVFYDPINNEAIRPLKNLAYMEIWTICSVPADHYIVMEG